MGSYSEYVGVFVSLDPVFCHSDNITGNTEIYTNVHINMICMRVCTDTYIYMIVKYKGT